MWTVRKYEVSLFVAGVTEAQLTAVLDDLNEVPEFDAEVILRQADALHEPVRGVFESVITDRLREEVLRND